MNGTPISCTFFSCRTNVWVEPLPNRALQTTVDEKLDQMLVSILEPPSLRIFVHWSAHGSNCVDPNLERVPDVTCVTCLYTICLNPLFLPNSP